MDYVDMHSLVLYGAGPEAGDLQVGGWGMANGGMVDGRQPSALADQRFPSGALRLARP
jgi:hypothetical protein